MRTIGICSSSRSEKHLVEALFNEINSVENARKGLQAEMIWIEFDGYNNDITLPTCDFLIIPADRSEMIKFALNCFHNNIPFCHYLAGSQSFSYCHDDVNRWLISLMANFCFAESPEAAENLKRVGIPEDRILVTGTSHFDGITNYDIEANKPKDAPSEYYDVILLNQETQKERTERPNEGNPYIRLGFNDTLIQIKSNEDISNAEGKEYSHLEFLYLLKHADHFISNSSAIHYEVPYLNKFCGANIKVINPSQRNTERTPIDPMYCKGASAKIAKWCAEVDLDWLKTPKRLFGKPSERAPFLSGL